GRYVAFDSGDNLGTAGGDRTLDIFRRDVLGTANQEARISIGDVSQAEGNTGQTAFRFTVSLDRAQPTPVSVDFSTADGTATTPTPHLNPPSNPPHRPAPRDPTNTTPARDNGTPTKKKDDPSPVTPTTPAATPTTADPQPVGTTLNDDHPVIDPPAQITINDV